MAIDTGKDYYAILGVAVRATSPEIRLAFRKAALKHHPDKNSGSRAAEALFKIVNEAHEILGDKERRHEYDSIRRLHSAKAPFTRPTKSTSPSSSNSSSGPEWPFTADPADSPPRTWSSRRQRAEWSRRTASDFGGRRKKRSNTPWPDPARASQRSAAPSPEANASSGPEYVPPGRPPSPKIRLNREEVLFQARTYIPEAENVKPKNDRNFSYPIPLSGDRSNNSDPIGASITKDKAHRMTKSTRWQRASEEAGLDEELEARRVEVDAVFAAHVKDPMVVQKWTRTQEREARMSEREALEAETRSRANDGLTREQGREMYEGMWWNPLAPFRSQSRLSSSATRETTLKSLAPTASPYMSTARDTFYSKK